MSKAYKVCPICEAHNHRNAVLCVTCGTTIVEIAPEEAAEQRSASAPVYDYRLGETDLAEASLSRRGRLLSIFLLAIVIAGIGGLAATSLAPRLSAGFPADSSIETRSPPTRLAGPTVTPGPPTATFTSSPMPTEPPTNTPTPAPCVHTVNAGDSLIAIITRCGYRNLAILPTVMAINGIADETRIQIGQEIVVPRPSPTRDPDAPTSSSAAPQLDAAGGGALSEGLARLAFDPFAPTLTPTLLPGLMWHDVQRDESMIVIAVQYKMNAKTLSDLNPEVDFLLCDFSQAYGGPECTVPLQAGQQIRVLAPTPTASPVPTDAGRESPGPPPTAAFNAPIAHSPPDNAFFAPLEQVTLRWIGTGRLADGDVYRITVTNADTGAHFQADTRELFFIVPAGWQSAAAGSHTYTWQVSVVDAAAGAPSYRTAERDFNWQGSGIEEP